MAFQIDNFAIGQSDQKAPEITAISQIAKSSIRYPSYESIQDAKCDILLVAYPLVIVPQLSPRDFCELIEITPPEIRDSILVAIVQQVKPISNWVMRVICHNLNRV